MKRKRVYRGSSKEYCYKRRKKVYTKHTVNRKCNNMKNTLIHRRRAVAKQNTVKIKEGQL